MSRVREWYTAQVVETIDRAATAGHDVDRLEHRKSAPGQQQGYYAVCSCGWESSPRGRRLVAAMAGLWHAMDVCDALDERKRLDLVEWSAAPRTPQLVHAMREHVRTSGVSSPTSHREAG